MIPIIAILWVLYQDADKGLRDAVESMDRSTDHLSKAREGDGLSHLDRSIRRQRQALEILDDMLRKLPKRGG